jgi:hypothetical protein
MPDSFYRGLPYDYQDRKSGAMTLNARLILGQSIMISMTEVDKILY